MGYLAKKPRILVTHQLQYLTDADHIIALSDVCFLALLNLLLVLFTCTTILHDLRGVNLYQTNAILLCAYI